MRATNHFGDGPYRFEDVAWPTTADEDIAFVSDAYDRWRTGVERLGADGLHGAEVACLRGLHRDSDHTTG